LDVSQDFMFRCNVCGCASRTTLAGLSRETPACGHCGSNARIRAMARLVALELVGSSIALPDVLQAKHLRGIGLSDTAAFAVALADRFDYVNTFLHAEPQLDIADADVDRYRGCDFMVASDVFEHVAPPVSRAFRNAYELLKPGGRLIFSVPFSLEPETIEHFPNLHDWRIEQLDDQQRLVNRAVDGTVTEHDNLVFHGGIGGTLEMRSFSRAGLEREFACAGFARVRVADEPYLPFGIYWSDPWSVPMVAYR